MKTYVVDVSEYQGPVDFKRVEREGFGGAFIKASGSANKGWAYTDPMFERNVVAVSDTALVRGIYHYLSPQHPRAQAALFSELYEEACTWPGERWAPIVDIENWGVTPGTVDRFLDTWDKINPQRPLAVYSRQTFWDKFLGKYEMPRSAPLITARWVMAQYRNVDPISGNRLDVEDHRYSKDWQYASQQAKGLNESDLAVSYGGKTRADLVQFTDNALVDGTFMDCSVFFGNATQLEMVLGLR
jgi:hypothetical protein